MSATAVAAAQNPYDSIHYGSVLLTADNPDEYRKLVDDHFKQYKPLAEHEIFFVFQLVNSLWRLRRARKMESECTTIDQLVRVGKYIAGIELSYNRAYNELKRIDAERTKISGIRYPFHNSHREKPKIQNEPKPAVPGTADLQFMLSEFQKCRR